MSLFDLPPAHGEQGSTALPLPPAPPSFSWTDEQSKVLDNFRTWKRSSGSPFFALTGPAGSGKSTLMREVTDGAVLTAMTGKAALRLMQCAGGTPSTLHKVLYWPPKTGEKLEFTKIREPEGTFYIVDEASMMGPAVFEHLRVWVNMGVRFLLVGDTYQLPPVITGKDVEKYGEDYSVFGLTQGAALETVMRSAGGVLRAATKIRQTAELLEESDLDGDNGYRHVGAKHVVDEAVDRYCSSPNDHLLITWRNAVRMQANKQIRARFGHDGMLPDEGEPVLIRKNGQGFLNGEVVTCGGFEEGPKIDSVQTLWMSVIGSELKILVSYEGGSVDKGGEPFDGGMPWIQNFRKYHTHIEKSGLPEPTPITWGYCVTAHAAQGSESDKVTVFLAHGDDRNRNFRKDTTLPSGKVVPFSARWLYTSLTRGKRSATMITSK